MVVRDALVGFLQCSYVSTKLFVLAAVMKGKELKLPA